MPMIPFVQAFRTFGIPARRASPGGTMTLAWGLCAGSLFCLLAGVWFGALMPALFLAAWLAYILAWPRRSLDLLMRVFVPWLLPALALTSILWSEAPEISTRLAIEYCLVSAAAIVMAGSVKPSQFLSAIMIAFLIAVLFGVANGGTQENGMTGATDLNGGVGSKNLFAQWDSLLILAAVGTLVDWRQPVILRVVACLASVLGIGVLLRAHSLDAIVALTAGLVVLVILSAQSP